MSPRPRRAGLEGLVWMGAAGAGLERQVELILQQARACKQLGSPFYARLLELLARDVAAGGVGAATIAGHEEDPGPSALALRLLAAVHRLVLAGEAPELARHYPSVGGDGDADAAWPAFARVLEHQVGRVRAGLASPPQTNEVGRAAPLFGGLLRVLGAVGELPVRLFEIGASAGLNLLADRFVYRTSDARQWPHGTAGGEVVLDPAWGSLPPGAGDSVSVVERIGCDLEPIDPRSPGGELALLSCVWPDQKHRLARLRGALRLARDHGYRLERAGAGEFLARLSLRDGTHTVVQHSVMWQYVPRPEQQAILERLQELGAGASTRRPLTHLSFEPRRLEPEGPHRFVIAATTWPGGVERILGEAPPHGVPVAWWD